MPDYPQCAACPYDWPDRACRAPGGKGPDNCPTLRERDLARESVRLLEADPALMEFARQASLQEAAGYSGREHGYAAVRPAATRLEEVAAFARRMGYRRLGLIFCGGLRAEGLAVHGFFTAQGFEAVSVMCKAGRVPKATLGLGQEDHVDTRCTAETMCNPVLQALAANRHGVELNVLLGLCVGHDALFIQHAKAPTTVLAVKDRVLGHNPLAAVHQLGQYYRSLLTPKED